MFDFLGQTVSRVWWLFLAAWVTVVVASRLAAPPWEDVSQDKEFAFLPPDAPSRRAEEAFAKAFPDDRPASNIVLVLSRADTKPEQRDQDLKFIEDLLEPRLRQIAEAEGGLAYEIKPSEEPLFPADNEPHTPPATPKNRSIIARIQTPNTLGTGALRVSPDQKALLVVVELTTEFLSTLNWPVIGRIENLVQELEQQGKVPAGLDIALTGSAVIGRDRALAQLQSVRATETLTVVLVVALLILIYRAPLLALIPLATVYLAVQVSINLLAILARAGYVTLFQGIQIYITILAYGAGVDYCLFLTARYKEALDQGASPREAVASAVGGVGSALVASAATVMFGIGMMVFAQFGKFRDAGIAIPLSIGLTLLATLTFSPALLRLAGWWAFWPQYSKAMTSSQGPAEKPSRPRHWLFRPGALQCGWEKVGEALLRRPGTVWLATVAVMAPFVVTASMLYNQLSYDLIGNLPADLPSVTATRILEERFPAGLIGPVTVLLVNPHVDFSTAHGREIVDELTDRLREKQKELALADVRTLSAPLGITSAANPGLTDLPVSKETRRQALEVGALDHYVTAMGERKKIGTRLDLVLMQSPFAHQSVENLERAEQMIQDTLPSQLRDGSQLYFAGPTASIRDLQLVVRGDRTRIEILVLASVLVILMVLLRTIGVPFYLLLSVLFSYYATLGVAFIIFWLLDPHGFTGIDWKVAIFLFTILIAVGEDYNIFLMARIHEEQRRHGPVRGITEALTRTGPIISSCGIIMAGTFSSLLAGSLTEMKQLGFALAFGILLDTFVVRPILVPSFLIWLAKRPERRSETAWAKTPD
jgi:RND superfamily putative drug exporter